MRELKFRFWSKHLHKFVIPDDNIFIGALKDPDMNPMQYTGLKDRNGKEIYQSDKLKDNYMTREVRYKEHMGAWYAGGKRLTKDFAATMEVVGNIYEIRQRLKEFMETK